MKQHKIKLIFENMFLSKIILGYLIILISTPVKSQSPNPPPGYEWKKVTYRDRDITNTPGLTQDKSGDEWWYSHKNLYDGNGNHIGYIAVGYLADLITSSTSSLVTKLIDAFNDGSDSPCNPYSVSWDPLKDIIIGDCLDFYDMMATLTSTIAQATEQRSLFRGMVARLDLNGNMLWCRIACNDGSGLQEVIQEGSYVYVIGSHTGAKNMALNSTATRTFVPYNPTSSVTASSNVFNKSTYSSITSNDGIAHMFIAKYDLDGNKIWERLYGPSTFSASPQEAWVNGTTGQDLIFNSNDNKIYAVGQASATSTSTNTQVFVVKIDPATGYYITHTLLAMPAASFANTYSELPYILSGRSICQMGSGGNMAIAALGEYKHNNIYVDWHRAFLYSIDQNLALNSSWSPTVNPSCFTATAGTQQSSSVWELNYHSANDEVMVATITDCDFCHHIGDQKGVGKIYRVAASTGTLISGNNPLNIGTISAFDLRVGVIETSDGGYAAVSAKQPVLYNVPNLSSFETYSTCPAFTLMVAQTSVNPYVPVYWDTDALIVKFDQTGTKKWEWCEDIIPGRQRQITPGDFKRAECMYKLTEAEDGGLVASGNCSYNHDDNYMVKLFPECGVTHTYNINGWAVTSSATLNASYDVLGKITIHSPAVLTITGNTNKIRMADSRHTGIPTYIEVKPGAKLELLNGAEITSIDNSCPGSMWDGIAVMGTSTLNQASSGGTIIPNQGFVSINTATISNARCAITTGTHLATGMFDWSSTGGVIWAHQADFINNGRDVQYLPYQSPSGPQIANAGLFNKCRFLTNSTLNDGSEPIGRVSMSGVNGVKFRGCEFAYNAGNAYTPTKHGYGIQSADANYDITDFCPGCMTPTQSQFKNLARGIEVYNSLTTKAVNVDHAVFTSTYTGATDLVGGILFSNVYGASIKRCTFDLVDNFSEGVFLHECKYYSVTSNTFSGNGGGTGIGVSQSKSGDHRIYRNNFQDHNYGILAQYENSAYYVNPPVNLNVPNDGLVMNCNTFSGTNNFNIAMTGYSVVGQYPCVARNQGILTFPLDDKKLVRNRYQSTCGGGNKWHISANQSLKNIEHAANSDSDTRPVPQPSCSSQLVVVHNSGASFSFSSACTETMSIPVSTPTCPCPSCCKLADINQGLANVFSNRDTWTTTYNNSIDGGNTQYLLEEIASGTLTGTEMADLVKQYNPYLSDEVLTAFFDNTDVDADNAIEVHEGNSPVTPEVWAVIESRGFESGKMDILITNQNANPVSQRQILENELSFAKSEARYVYAQKVNYYITDTLEGSRDTLIHLLATNLGELPDAVTQRVDAYAIAGYLSRAEDYADSLSDYSEYEETVTLQLALLALQSADNGIYSLPDLPGVLSVIEEYAEDSTMSGCYRARAVLNQVYGRSVFIDRLYPEDLGERWATPQSSEEVANIENGSIQEELVNGKVRIFPNPAANSFTIRYETDIEISAHYSMRDVLGKIVSEGKIKQNKDNEINIQSFNKGIYFITLIQGHQLLSKYKLVVME